MNPLSNIESVFTAAANRIKDEIHKDLEGYNARNILISSIAIHGYTKTGLESIRKETIKALEKVAMSKPSKGEWKQLKLKAIEFIESQCNSLWNNANKMWKQDADISKDLYEKLKPEIISEVDSFVEGQTRTANEKTKVIIWDIAKILLGVILGAILSSYFKK